MKVLIVGGNSAKRSGVVTKLQALFDIEEGVEYAMAINGYDPKEPVDMKGFDLILWWPDVDNEKEKVYPIKDQGAVLICSKVLRACDYYQNHITYGNICNDPTRDKMPSQIKYCRKDKCPGPTNQRTRIDAVTRIFKMHGNAVVAITTEIPSTIRSCKNCQKDASTCKLYSKHCHQANDYRHFEVKKTKFNFQLIDALNNTWRDTTNLPKLVHMMLELYKWTKNSKRKSLIKNDMPENTLADVDFEEIDRFLSINRVLAEKVAAGCGNRFFGNYSTRCTKLFPSTRKGKDYFFFSPRNIDKRYVSTKDLVLTDSKYYYGDVKPSVDTPVQLDLYEYLPGITWMIHGHAYIAGAETTDQYFPCGDLREVDEVLKIINETQATRINLKNHGFLLMGKDLNKMQTHLNDCEFDMIGGI